VSGHWPKSFLRRVKIAYAAKLKSEKYMQMFKTLLYSYDTRQQSEQTQCKASYVP